MLIALFVAVRILASPVSNVFQKQLVQRSANPVFIIGATHALLTLGCLPLVFVGSLPLDPRFLMLIALFVAVRILASPVSNVFQKQLVQRSANPVFIIGATHALLTLDWQ